MNILITGANGFIGKNLIRRLKREPDTQLYTLSRHKMEMEGVHQLTGDVLQMQTVEDAFSAQSFDTVIHLAAITEHDAIVGDRMRTFETNLYGTMNVLHAFNAHCCNAQFIYSSTGKVYGATDEMPITEKARIAPTGILGKSKYITEQVIDLCAEAQNHYLVCRIFNVFGEWQRRGFVVPTIIDQLSEEEIRLGNLQDYRDYLYIDDVVTALASCIYHRDAFAPVDVVNIGSGQPACVDDILREMGRIIGRKLNVCTESSRQRTDELDTEFCSFQKLNRLTGWKPSYTLADGLRKTLTAEGVVH